MENNRERIGRGGGEEWMKSAKEKTAESILVHFAAKE